jgi:RHS repeat-associated protein
MPLLMTDESGSIVWEGEFLPFGEALSITGTITNNLRFPGQYYDSETGLHYNYFRDYKPEIGRYVEADISGIMKGINHLYAYANNNPIYKIDLKGLTPLDPRCWWAICKAKIKCGSEYKKAADCAHKRIYWCEKAFIYCKMGMDVFDPGEKRPTEEECSKKWRRYNDRPSARLACINSREFKDFIKATGKCALAVVDMARKCGGIF